MDSTAGDTDFRGIGGTTGEHTCDFMCFDTIGRVICCFCGAILKIVPMGLIHPKRNS